MTPFTSEFFVLVHWRVTWLLMPIGSCRLTPVASVWSATSVRFSFIGRLDCWRWRVLCFFEPIYQWRGVIYQKNVLGSLFGILLACRCHVWFCDLGMCLMTHWCTRYRSWSRHCATSWKVAGSISVGVFGVFHWLNPSGRTMAPCSTQPLTEMSTRDISGVIKAAGE